MKENIVHVDTGELIDKFKFKSIEQLTWKIDMKNEAKLNELKLSVSMFNIVG